MTSWGNTLRGTALAVGAVLALTGCKDSADGAASPIATDALTTSAATRSADPDAALWNPCDLPESAISGTGLDPATKEKDVAGVDFTGWKVCGWRADTRWYDMTVFSGTPTLQAVQQRPDFESFVVKTIDARKAVEFRDVGDTKQLKCSIAVESPQGTILFRVATRYSIGKQGDPCVEVLRHASDLSKYLPEG
ncbi:DUF3558 domain-containing protein [Nocardia sp. NPDC049220]|uniref:DUF3558 domain-containing protein n=1 Tax=Nocardia sp. NPDC049220 TaxID=3155273 RepID=UPI0033E65EDD